MVGRRDKAETQGLSPERRRDKVAMWGRRRAGTTEAGISDTGMHWASATEGLGP